MKDIIKSNTKLRSLFKVLSILSLIAVCILLIVTVWGCDSPSQKASDLVSRGNLLLKSNQYDLAIEKFISAIQISPNDIEAYDGRAQAFYMKKDYDAAINDCIKIIDLKNDYETNLDQGIVQPEDVDLGYLFADYYVDHALVMLGDAYIQKQEYDQAVIFYSKILELDPKDSYALNRRAYAYSVLKDYDNAIADYNLVIDINQDPYSLNNLAYIYIKKNDRSEYDKAIILSSRAIFLDPKFAYAYDTRAEVYWNRGWYNLAIEDSDKAIELNSTEAYFFRNRGIAYKLKGEFDKAIVDFNNCIQLSNNEALSQEVQQLIDDIKIQMAK